MIVTKYLVCITFCILHFFSGDSSVKAVFGISLEEHLRVTNRIIAYPLELCVCALTELGMSEEGLFRVAGGNKI